MYVEKEKHPCKQIIQKSGYSRQSSRIERIHIADVYLFNLISILIYRHRF